jgi:hypothetical protein
VKSRTLLALFLVLTVSLACSVGGGGESAPEASEQPPTQGEAGEGESTSEEGAAEEATSPEIDADALAGLDSYRMRMTTQWAPEGEAPESWTTEQEYTREPAAQRWTMEGSGEDETIEWVQIEDMAWFCIAGTCTQTQQSEEELAASFGQGMLFDPADFATDSDYEYVGQETVNGVRTRHYTLDFSLAEMALLAQGEISDAEGGVWIADEGDLPAFVARSEVSWRETRGEQAGTAEFSYDVYDVNEPITIEPPEGAGEGVPEDVPLYPDATDLTIMAGFITFVAPDDSATVADFYRAELPAQGWTSEEDSEFGGMITQTWQKEGRSLSLMISPEEDTSTVMITIEEP